MQRTKSFTHAPHQMHDAREASTLLIVMVLLGMLSLIGFLFLTFAANERSNAAYWADSQKVYVPDLDPDTLFDWSLKQLIVGPDASLTQSALFGQLNDAGGNFHFGSRHAMLPNMLGRDIHPYNSSGIKLGSNASGPFVDLDHDDSPDSGGFDQEPLDFNDSRNVNRGSGVGEIRDLTGWPDPGVDYTYPDINNLFLAYKGFAIAADGTPVQVIIPSFHRPQLLRNATGAIASWWNDATLAGRMLRPHPNHLNPSAHPQSGNANRYPSAVPEYAGDPLTTPFPFRPGVAGNQGVWTSGYSYGNAIPTYEWDVDNDGDLIKEGVWLDLQYPVQTDSLGQKYVPLFSFTVYDADGLFNLNAHGGHQGLASLTNMGEIATQTQYLSRSNQGLTSYEINLQRGLNADPSELTAATTQLSHQYGMSPTTQMQLSNMEWARLLFGTANFQSPSAFNDLYPGRYGEISRLYNALLASTTSTSAAATLLSSLSYPGLTDDDDNHNQFEGTFNWELASGATAPYFPSLSTTYYPPLPYGQPLDFDADGSVMGTIVRDGMSNMELMSGYATGSPGDSNYGKSRLMIRNTSAAEKTLQFPAYLKYDNPGANATNTVAAGFHNGTGTLAGEQMTFPVYNSMTGKWYAVPYLPGVTPPVTQLDEPWEMIVDPVRASTLDTIFPYDEMAALHLSLTDRNNLGLSSRLRTLLPFNFGANTRADDTATKFGIAQQFSVASWDRRQFGYAGTGVNREWEVTGGTTFPPNYGGTMNLGTDPFRPAVRKLLGMTIGSTTTTAANQFQFRLSLNHLTVLDTAGNPARRELTPHELNLAEAAVAGGSQEALARLDRQQMARDIYVMLYTLGGGLDQPTSQSGKNGHTGAVDANGYTGDNSGFNLYSERQLREMAQFAVNVVDALDSDNVMTKFEYDKNLGTDSVNGGSGWELDDNAYTPDGGSNPKFDLYTSTDNEFYADYPEDSPERGVVYGVETQDVVLSEVLAFFCPKVENTMTMMAINHDATAHDDRHDRYFTYIELRNIGTSRVTFDGQYRLRAIPDGGVERRLTLTGNNVAPGALYSIGNAGQADQHDNSADPNDGVAPLTSVDLTSASPPDDLNHSRFRCDNPTCTGANTDPNFFTQPAARIVPTSDELDLDLLANRSETPAKFILSEANGTDITSDTTGYPGGFVNGATLADPQNPQNHSISFVLERRQYPDRDATDPTNDADNPWIPVDRMSLAVGEFQKFGLKYDDAMRGQYQSHLEVLRSSERAEPLLRANGTYDPAGEDPHANATVANSLTEENSNAPANFLVYQNRTDRPFASPVELLEIPLYGPHNVSRWTKFSVPSGSVRIPTPYFQASQFELEHASFSTSIGSANEVPTAATAAGKILQPEHFNNLTRTPTNKVPADDNRWYRLFDFFEVPMRNHRQLGNPMNLVQQPGKINLNGVRHPAVLAGALDDSDVMTFAEVSTTRPKLYSNDNLNSMYAIDDDLDSLMDTGTVGPLTSADAGYHRRDWWVQFLKSRDGRLVDTGTALERQADSVTGLFLPGLADSTPFRSAAMAGFVKTSTRQSPQDALESTIFRKLPIDAAVTDPRHLWEVGTAGDHLGTGEKLDGSGSSVPSNIDSVMRNRLLSKIYNNTTTRSHVFIVFVTVQLFEADDSAGAANVRIGGPLTNGATYRGFFVIDRSKPEDAYDSATGTFSNFRALIKHRQLLN